ncbi:MAG TPA: glycosyltransferase [Jatrophihabitantaceae bacterium]|nr:glycosyltransferase [Jatrophihabitantaceae bacterium]
MLAFGTYDVTTQPRVGVLIEGLRDHGVDVVEINRPLGFTTAERVRMLSKPWLAYRFAFRLLGRWIGLVRGTTSVRRTGRFDAVLVGYLGHFDVVLARLLFPRTVIALDLMIFAADTARDRDAAGKLKLSLLDALDRLAASCADLVIVDTEEQLELLGNGQRAKGIVVPVGASRAWFDAAQDPTAAGSGKLRVVFFGMFTPLQGTHVIGEALALLADATAITVTIIGTGQTYAATRAAAGDRGAIRWFDWVEPEDLPAVVAAHEVCLGVFGTSNKALRVAPHKIYQGAAAGCSIITSDTPPQRRALGDAARYIAPGDPVALADALRTLATDEAGARDLRIAARSVAIKRFTPMAVVAGLCERLADMPGDRET